MMSYTPLPKAAKPVWAKQLSRLPCLVVYVKFQFVYTSGGNSNIGYNAGNWPSSSFCKVFTGLLDVESNIFLLSTLVHALLSTLTG